MLQAFISYSCLIKIPIYLFDTDSTYLMSVPTIIVLNEDKILYLLEWIFGHLASSI